MAVVRVTGHLIIQATPPLPQGPEAGTPPSLSVLWPYLKPHPGPTPSSRTWLTTGGQQGVGGGAGGQEKVEASGQAANRVGGYVGTAHHPLPAPQLQGQ